MPMNKSRRGGRAETVSLTIMTALLVALFLIPTPADAVRTRFHVDQSINDFLRGTLNGASVTADGNLVPSPSLELLQNLEQKFVWSLAQAPEGDIFVGLGDNGSVQAINEEGELRDVIETDGVAIFDMIWWNDALLMGVSPGGQLLSVTPTGDTRTVATFDSSYIWDIEPLNGREVLVALGDPARVVKVSASGSTETLLSAEDETHFNKIAQLGGDVYVSSVGKGLIYRLGQGNQAQVVFDSYENEIGDMKAATDGQSLIVTTATRVAYPPRSSDDYTDTFQQFGRRPVQSDSRNNQQNSPPIKNSVYSIRASGDVAKLATFDQLVLPSVLPLSDGSMLIGTGDDGAIIHLDAFGVPRVALDLADQQILTLRRAPNGTVLVGTGNMGKIYRLSFGRQEPARYLSRVFDSEYQAAYGQTQLRLGDGSGPVDGVRLFLRTGDSERPDDSWSDWRGPVQVDAPAADVAPGRYVQYRLELEPNTSQPARVAEVRLPFVRRNQPPRITQFEIESVRPTSSSSRSNSDNNNSNNQQFVNAVKMSWTATDPNDDTLSYNLSMRHIDENEWIPILYGYRQTQLLVPINRLPSGEFIFRLTANDEPSNESGTSQHVHEFSSPFTVDYTPPSVEVLELRENNDTLDVRIRVQDEHSFLDSIVYSVNYLQFFAVGGDSVLLDRRDMEISFQVDLEHTRLAAVAGRYVLVITVEDMSANAQTVILPLEYSPARD